MVPDMYRRLAHSVGIRQKVVFLETCRDGGGPAVLRRLIGRLFALWTLSLPVTTSSASITLR
jgi:hypothetical protein